MAAKQPHKRPLPNGYIAKGGNDAFDNHPMPHYMTSNPKAIHVRVHANNERFEPGKIMTIAANKTKTFENFLNECTEKLKPTFGAARRLYTPSGRRRIQQLDELHEDSIYVITGTESFKRLNYREIPDRLRPARHKRFKKIDIDRIYKVVQHARDEHYRQKSGQCLRKNAEEHGLLLRVSVNGRPANPSFPVSIRTTLQKDIESVKNVIQESMQLDVLKRIYKVANCGGCAANFTEVTDPRELHRDDHVLVMERRDVQLKPCFYKHNGLDRFKCPVSPRHHGIQGLFPPPEPVGRFPNKYSVIPSIASSKQSEADTMSPLSNHPGSHGGRKTKRSKGHREVDYDKDEAGVFRAKKQNNSRGAHQEEIHTKEKTTPIPPGTELNKQPSKETKQNTENASQTKTKAEEKVDEDASPDAQGAHSPEADGNNDFEQSTEQGMHHMDEYNDDSFNRYDQNTSRNMTRDPRSSTPASRDEEMRKRQKKEHEAATKIQAGAKAYKARKDYAKMKEAKKRDEENKRQQEKEVERFKEDSHQKEDEARKKEKKERDEHEAATKIQAQFKGYKTRKAYNSRKQQVKQ